MRFSFLAVPAIALIGGAVYFFAGAKASSERLELRVRPEPPPAVAPQDVLADESDRQVIRMFLAAPVLSDKQNFELVRAAGRRYIRRKISYEAAEKMVAAGKLDAASIDDLRKQMDAARKVCDVAEGMGRMQEMAAAAQSAWEMELRLANMPGMKGLAEKYDGFESFSEADLDLLAAQFKTVYGRELPVSTRGESPLHRSMGFDHRGRFDVALSPSSPEGVWVRRYLTGKHVPFLAFRGAVRGQATGAHIHIGKPSTRASKV